jgi:hypothetical protein
MAPLVEPFIFVLVAWLIFVVALFVGGARLAAWVVLAVGLAPLALGFAHLAYGTARDRCRDARARRTFQGKPAPRIYTHAGDELWVLWLPGARLAAAGIEGLSRRSVFRIDVDPFGGACPAWADHGEDFDGPEIPEGECETEEDKREWMKIWYGCSWWHGVRVMAFSGPDVPRLEERLRARRFSLLPEEEFVETVELWWWYLEGRPERWRPRAAA